MSLKNADEIRRKDSISKSVRTEGKDDAAETIDAIIEAGEWPMDLSEIAERAGWSRQHIANTLEGYYEAVEDDDTQEPRDHDGLQITVPDDVDKMSYLRGWIDCYSQR